MIILFLVLAVIFATANSMTFSARMESIYARYGFIALAWAAGSALAAIWLAVAGL